MEENKASCCLELLNLRILMLKTQSSSTDYSTFGKKSSIFHSPLQILFPHYLSHEKEWERSINLEGNEAERRKGHRFTVLHRTTHWWAGLLYLVTGLYLSVELSFISKFIFSLSLEGKYSYTKAIVTVSQPGAYWKCWQLKVPFTLKSQWPVFLRFLPFQRILMI